LTISIMEALWATILFSGFALEVIIRQKINFCYSLSFVDECLLCLV